MNDAKRQITQTNSLNAVFDCIRLFGPITKKEIQQRTGLSWGSISNNTICLLNGAVISEKTAHLEGKGRNPSVYEINHDKNWIIGLDVQMDCIRGAVLTLDGKVVSKVVVAPKTREASGVYSIITGVLERLFNSVETPEEIHWIGLSMPGLIENEHGKPIRAHHFYGTFPPSMQEIIKWRFGVPTEIFHDPGCALVAHRNYMLSKELGIGEQGDVLLIRWSYGIGLSMLLNGELYFGSGNAAGEMGHMVIDPGGPACLCGQNGCLEVYAAVRSIVKKVRKCVDDGCCGDGLELSGELDTTDIWRAYENGNDCVISIVDEAVDYMSTAIINVTRLLDPSIIIIEGTFASAPDKCMERLKNTVFSRIQQNKHLVIRIHDWEDSPVVGASEMLIERVFAKICEKISFPQEGYKI